MDKSKSIYRAAGHYHWVLLTFIIVIIIIVIINDIWFVYLSIFIANKFILTTVNKNFSYFKSFKILLTCRISPPEVFSRRGGCFVDVLRISGGISVHGCDFNKVAKRLCWARASLLVFFLWVYFMSEGIFLGEHLWRTVSERR